MFRKLFTAVLGVVISVLTAFAAKKAAEYLKQRFGLENTE